jgi:hypothetical protein
VTHNIIDTVAMHLILASILLTSSLYIFYKELVEHKDKDLAIIDN